MEINNTPKSQIKRQCLITGGGYGYNEVFRDESSILLFYEIDENVNSQQTIHEHEKDAIKNSFLYAQIDANEEYEKISKQDDWYNVFTKVMKTLGWGFGETALTFKDYNKDSFNLKMLLLDSLENLSEKERGLTIALFDGFKNISLDNKEKLERFIKSSTDGGNANLRFGICTKNDEGKIILKLVALYFNTNESLQNLDLLTMNFHGTNNVFKVASKNVLLDISTYDNNVKQSQINIGDYVENLESNDI